MRQLTFWQSTSSAQAFAAAQEIDEVVVAKAPSAPTSVFCGTGDLPAMARWLSGMLGQAVQLTITRNRTTMVSYRCTPHGYRLRLHRIFLTAGDEPMRSLVDFVLGDKQASKDLERFVQQNAHLVGPGCIGPIRVQGAVHDLQSIFAEVNETYFHSACKAAITWGAPNKPRGKRSVRLGIYLHEQALICLHPALDQPFVPRFYVAFVVFHEMLHELFGIRQRNGRRTVHPVEMRVVQSCHPDYAACKAWEAENLQRLLDYRPMPRRDRGKLSMRTALVAASVEAAR